MAARLFQMLVVALGVATLTGCGGASSMTPGTGSSPSPELSSATLRTLDPCALLPTAKLRKLHSAARLSLGEKVATKNDEGGSSEPGIRIARGEEFGTCRAAIPRKTPKRSEPGFDFANVTLNLAAPLLERIGSGKENVGGGFTATAAILEEREKACGVILFTPLNIPFELVTTSPSGELPATELCAVNREVRSIVVRGLAAGKPRKLLVDARSLRTHSPCDALQPSVHVRWPQAQLTPGTWSCHADSPAGPDAGESAHLRFKLNQRLGDDVPNNVPVSIASRSAVQSSPDAKSCRVEAHYTDFPGGLGRAIETIEVTTTVKGDEPGAACHLATTMAEDAFRQLDQD